MPDLDEKAVSSIVKIFSFFNAMWINDVKGEYFLYGLSEAKRFNLGLSVELQLPDCQLYEFLHIAEDVLSHFDVERFLVLTDIADGTNLLKMCFENLDFLRYYRPTKNLRWNARDRIWMNLKPYDKHFEPQYPELVPREKDQDD